MITDTGYAHFDFNQPLTKALRRALPHQDSAAAAEDLMFLERWEISPSPLMADALRVAQLRRANPELAAAIRDELATRRHPTPTLRA